MRETPRTRVVLAVLVVAALTLITLDTRSNSGAIFTRVRDAASAVFGPVERAVAAGVRPIGNAFGALAHAGSNRATIRRLEQQNAALRAEVATSASARRQLAQLEKLMGLAGAAGFRILPAHVVAIGGENGFQWTATIDVGAANGVTPEMTVIDGGGLVGRTLTVSAHTSTILLAADPTSRVGARLAGTGAVGWVVGGGTGPMTFTSLDPHTRLKPGQVLVTFGSQANRPYVAEVPIGTVTRVTSAPTALTPTALVNPFSQLQALDTVGVVVATTRTLPRDALVPPSPAPAPTARPTPSTSPGATALPAPSPTG